MVWYLRDDARFLGLAGHHREASDALKRALGKMAVVAPPGAAEKFSDFDVHVLSMLARSELRFDDAAECRRYCRAILDHCRQRNCYAHDGLRVCMLLPDAVDDWQQLVDVAKDATSRGSRTLRKKANVGAALYRAGQYEEAIRVLKIVQESNGMALAAGLGSAEIVRADNARVAVFLAMAHARLGRSDDAGQWLAKAHEWIDGEGRRFAATRPVSADQAGHSSEENVVPTIIAQTTAIEPSSAAAQAVKRSARLPDLEDRMLLADIVFELQVLLSEADSFADVRAR